MSERRKCLKVTLNVDVNSRAANGINYLELLDESVHQGLRMALGCLYSPLYKAMQGESLEAIEKDIALSRSQFEVLMQLSKSLYTGDACFSGTTATTELKEDDSFSPSVEIPTVGNGHHHFDKEDLLDLSNEIL